VAALKVTVPLDRRFQSTLVVALVWGIVGLLHWQPKMQGLLLAIGAVSTIQALRMLMAKPDVAPAIGEAGITTTLPTVSILVPAQNEATVLTHLVHSLFHLDYPATHLDIWIVDDGSTDETPHVLNNLQLQFPRLRVHQRASAGGKSGALNAVFPLTQGEVVVVCDADAQVPANFLQLAIPLFQQPAIGAVQVRKTISNQDQNFLTRCQQMEMSCDAFLQTHRLAITGMPELRGNGMFVRRSILEHCQGWNEATVTDDLDLTFKLYLAGTDIAFVAAASIQEEGVTTWGQLWHQRCRWAEGGYQRYLDYGPQLLTLDGSKTIDLLLFFLLQFLLPIALIPDLLWTLFYDYHSVLLPLQTLLSVILTVSLLSGLHQFQGLRGGALLWATFQGSLYMLHWIPVIVVTTLRLCVILQTFQWRKTEHLGNLKSCI